MVRRLLRLAAAVLLAAAPATAFAWGNAGHRIVGEAAMRALPSDMPAFLRTPRAAADLGELSREPDRLRDSGKMHDADRDPAHFIDLDDEGRAMGGPRFDALPPTRADYETALRAVGADSWKAGYLPYAIIDRWQHLTKAFAYWRVLQAAERNPKWASHRAWYAEDRRRREALIFATLGDLGHFVGDASQPLHLSVHYNGWGDYPNPKGYTRAKIHVPFEGPFVKASVSPSRVAIRMSPLRAPKGGPEAYLTPYLQAGWNEVGTLYDLEKAGAFQPGDRLGAAFAEARLAAGASALRDMIVMAWRASADETVGWKPVQVSDVVAGKVDPFDALYGAD